MTPTTMYKFSKTFSERKRCFQIISISRYEFRACGSYFCDNTIFNIAIQMITVLEQIHDFGIIHRDLKPQSNRHLLRILQFLPLDILVGTWPKETNRLFLIDFGLSKQFITKEDDDQRYHVPMKNPMMLERQALTGTVRYASTNAHYGNHSRRDDLISLGYVLV